MNEIYDLFDIALKKAVCIGSLSEDDLRRLVDALGIIVKDERFQSFVRSSNGTEVLFGFDSNGNFSGVTARLGGKVVPLFPGNGSKELSIFEGPPSATNPGYGWEIETDLTKKYLNQSGSESSWEIFYAKRIPVLNV